MTRLDQLRCARRGEDRQAIRAMILEIECGFTKSPASSQAAPESAVSNQAGIAATSRDDGIGPTPQAGREVEDNGRRQSNAPGAFAQPSAEAMQTGLPHRVRSLASAGEVPGGQVPDLAAAPFRAARDDPDVAGNVTGQSIESSVGPDCRETAAEITHEAVTAGKDRQPICIATRECALGGCEHVIACSEHRLYCSQECANQARRLSRWRAAESARSSVIDKLHPEADPRQNPPGRPSFALPWDSAIIILPDCPAPPRRYSNGRPTPFQDDLNARADHGSPGQPRRADNAWRSPTVSALALAI